MAIVHPAFCVVLRAFQPDETALFKIGLAADRKNSLLTARYLLEGKLHGSAR
jgi:hypothetical protein